MCACPCTADSLRAAKRSVRALYALVEAKGGPCRLDIILVAHSRRDSALHPCRDPWQYPINALRNVALGYASTELVILLDADFLPGLGIQEQLWKVDVYAGYFRACTDLRRVVVLPALQESTASENITPELSSLNRGHQVTPQIVSLVKADVEKLWNEGKLLAFASDVYPPGHAPTDTESWISSVVTYEVQYEDGYEPYFLCACRLVPWYDERFTGYGKNKIIHAFHIAMLDFRFWVHPEWYVVHVDHVPSIAWQATLGSDPLAKQHLSSVKLLYEIVKDELVSFPSHTGVCLSLGKYGHDILSTRVHRNTWWCRERGPDKTREDQMGHWSCADKPTSLLLQTSTKECLQTLYDLRYHFDVPRLHPVAGIWPMRSQLPRRPRDISLVTVATFDRLQRLLAQCRQWKGVICAAIYAPHSANIKALEKQLLELHLEVEKARACRLDLILLHSAIEDEENCFCKEPRITPCYHSCGSRSFSKSDLCPINALRNAALGLATTDLVLLLDVDLLPAASLNDCFLDEQQYKCLWRMTMEERTAVVIPSFEYTAISPDTLTEKSAQIECEEMRYISNAEEMTQKGVSAISKGLTDGTLRGFHVKHYPTGHGPTDFERWREHSQPYNTQSELCCEVCRSYPAQFAEGFEPFVICSRKLIPRFDERFRGYGYNKVTFFYHLHLIGFGFQVLVHSFALDIPHAKSPDWMKTFGPEADPLQVKLPRDLKGQNRIRVVSLYHRAKRELHLVTGLSGQESGVVDVSSAHFMKNFRNSVGSLPRSYNHLSISDTSGQKHKKSSLEGLKPRWHGVICRQGSHHEISCDYHQQEESQRAVCHKEETRIAVVDEITRLSSKEDASRRTFTFSEGDETRDHHLKTAGVEIRTTFTCSCFGLKDVWASRREHPNAESTPSDSTDWAHVLEEFPWESSGWELKCHPDSLSNCNVVKVLQRNSDSNGEVSDNGGYWLRISMSAGSWSPHASRLAGITTGGVSVRSFLSTRAVKEVVLRYMVRFPSSFQWVKGGTLPGFWINGIAQTNFGWRRAGEGHLSSNLIGQSCAESDTTASGRKNQKLLRQFYFVPGQWHALQLQFYMVDQANTLDVDLKRSEQLLFQLDKKNMCKGGSFPNHPLYLGSIQDGNVLVIVACADFELVSKIRYPPCKQKLPNVTNGSEEPGSSMGLVLSCYFGGKTQDWATLEDTHIDFSQFEVWTE